jgi:serine/threonine-protein kinase RsbW
MTVRVHDECGRTRQGRGPEADRMTVRTFRCYAEMAAHLDALLAQLQALGYGERDCFGIRLALEEAMVNALKHGHKGDSAREATLRYELSEDSVLAEVEDQGPGFDPGTVPDPLAPENLERPTGRGLLLMRRYMSWVRFSSRGNRVSMCRHRSP